MCVVGFCFCMDKVVGVGMGTLVCSSAFYVLAMLNLQSCPDGVVGHPLSFDNDFFFCQMS